MEGVDDDIWTHPYQFFIWIQTLTHSFGHISDSLLFQGPVRLGEKGGRFCYIVTANYFLGLEGGGEKGKLWALDRPVLENAKSNTALRGTSGQGRLKRHTYTVRNIMKMSIL
jgi:hypothetical protein